ncbi:TPA: hypothetical protein ACJFV9_004399 [Salmonella enterica subsp. enterica serovar Infantis]
MAISEAYRKALAQKHLTKPKSPRIEAHNHRKAVRYIQSLQSGIVKELSKLDDELEQAYQYSNKPEYREHAESHYIHTRAVLMGIHEKLSDEIKAWGKFHTHK